MQTSFSINTNRASFIYAAQNHSHMASVFFTVCTVNDFLWRHLSKSHKQDPSHRTGRSTDDIFHFSFSAKVLNHQAQKWPWTSNCVFKFDQLLTDDWFCLRFVNSNSNMIDEWWQAWGAFTLTLHLSLSQVSREDSLTIVLQGRKRLKLHESFPRKHFYSESEHKHADQWIITSGWNSTSSTICTLSGCNIKPDAFNLKVFLSACSKNWLICVKQHNVHL